MLTIIRHARLIKTQKTIKLLEYTSVDLLPWFKNKRMRANADKSHLLVNSKEKVFAKIGPCDI